MKLRDAQIVRANSGLNFNLENKHGKRKRKPKIEVGKSYTCKSDDFSQPIIGTVEKLYNNSALVRIGMTCLADDHLIDIFKGRTVISFKNMELS